MGIIRTILHMNIFVFLINTLFYHDARMCFYGTWNKLIAHPRTQTFSVPLFPVRVPKRRSCKCLLLLLRIRSAHLQVLGFPMGDAY